MADLDFPSSPVNGQEYAGFYFDTASGAWRSRITKSAQTDRLNTLTGNPVIPGDVVIRGNITSGGNTTLGGRLYLPNQPKFFVTSSGMGDVAGSVTATGFYNFNSISFNVGGGYNASTGRFTAPVTGTYRFQVQFLCRGGGSVEGYWYKSGVSQGRWGMFMGYGTGDNHGTIKTEWMVSLTAGDYIQVYAYISNANIYGGGELFSTFGGELVS